MPSAKLSTAMRPAPACQGTPEDLLSAGRSASSMPNVRLTSLASSRSVKILASELAESKLTARWSTTMPSVPVQLVSEETRLLSALWFLLVSNTKLNNNFMELLRLVILKRFSLGGGAPWQFLYVGNYCQSTIGKCVGRKRFHTEGQRIKRVFSAQNCTSLVVLPK